MLRHVLRNVPQCNIAVHCVKHGVREATAVKDGNKNFFLKYT